MNKNKETLCWKL